MREAKTFRIAAVLRATRRMRNERNSAGYETNFLANLFDARAHRRAFLN